MLQSDFEFGREHEISDLIGRYEAMLSSGESVFFDQSAFEDLIDHYEGTASLSDALKVCDYAIQQHSYSSTFYIRKAQLLIDLEDPREALDILDGVSLIDNSELDIYLTKADALSLLGNYDEAIETLREAYQFASDEDKYDILISKAAIYEDQEKYADSYYILKKIVLKKPDYPEAIERFSYLVDLANKYEESIQVFKDLIDYAPYNAKVWYSLGCSYESLEMFEEAAEAYEYAYIIDSNFELAYQDAADMHINLQNFDKALDIYKEEIEIFGENADILIEIGVCYELKGDSFRAKDFYLKSLALDSNSDEAYFRLGRCYMSEGSWQSALTALHKANHIDSANTDYMIALGEVYYQMDDIVNAEEFFQKAITEDPDDIGIRVHYFATLIHSGLEGEALDHIMALDEVMSEYVEIDYLKFVCLYKMKFLFEALTQLNLALIRNYSLHVPVFQLFPELLEDPTILSAVNSSSN